LTSNKVDFCYLCRDKADLELYKAADDNSIENCFVILSPINYGQAIIICCYDQVHAVFFVKNKIVFKLIFM